MSDAAITTMPFRRADLPDGIALASLADLGHLQGDTDDCCIRGVADDTRLLQAGDAWLALPRSQAHAAEYADAAAAQGAVAIIAVGAELAASLDTTLPVLTLADMAQAGELLRRILATTANSCRLIGITGTDGKTSVTWMVREALSRLQSQPVWSTGTLGWMQGVDQVTDIGNTTPSLLTMHNLLAAAEAAAVFALVSEVSSHGVAQQRIAGLKFDAALWTTIGHDHLQDHGGYAPYLQAKTRFVQQVADAGGLVVANADYDDIRRHAPAASCWYGHGLYRDDVDLAWEQELPGMLRLKVGAAEAVVESIPLGDFHAENIAGAALLLMQLLSLPLEALPPLLDGMTAPPGRLQEIEAGAGQVYVDYAHTPEALERCLQAARKLTRHRLIVLFGCGGERDREKRPQMGEIATEYADVVWITSDNPRGEMPAVIASEIEQGMPQPYRAEVHLELDREQAIAAAIAQLREGDLLVIAGKGHESYMEVCGRRTPWSDAAVATRYLRGNHPLQGMAA